MLLGHGDQLLPVLVGLRVVLGVHGVLLGVVDLRVGAVQLHQALLVRGGLLRYQGLLFQGGECLLPRAREYLNGKLEVLGEVHVAAVLGASANLSLLELLVDLHGH